jgi:carbon catabolite-derepressing protein kinase
MRRLRVEIGEEEVELPQTFGSYEVVRIIGSGAFSVAVLVHGRLTNAQFACKVVSRAFLARKNAFHRFEQEVRLLEMMHHPHIVQVLDVIYSESLIFVVMEFCSGGELFQYLVDHGRLRDGDCRRLFAAIVSAVAHLHSRGIAHRDLKPENILLGDGLVPKLADLGLCRMVSGDALMTTPCGSPHYAAPEVLSGKGYDGRASDIWSLGVVLFVMATATVPWRSTTQARLFAEIAQAEYRIPGYLSPELRDLIRAMLNVSAGERPTIAEVAKSQWLSAEEGPLGLPSARGIAKATSLEYGPGLKAAWRADWQPPGRSLIVKPALPASSSLVQGKAGPAPLDALIRRVPSSAGRRKPPGLQKIPTAKNVD